VTPLCLQVESGETKNEKLQKRITSSSLLDFLFIHNIYGPTVFNFTLHFSHHKGNRDYQLQKCAYSFATNKRM